MDTPSELARDAYYETRDRNLPRCSKCQKSEREVSLVWCGARYCDNSICDECATPAQWQLEACSEECEVAVAIDLADREAKLRHQIHGLRRELRKQAARETGIESERQVA